LGGGAILTLSHPFDYLRWILGEAEPLTSVSGTFGDLGLTVEDMAEVTLRFPGGALGTIHLDYLQTPPSHWLEIVGGLGTIHWDNSDGAVRRWTSEEGAWIVTPAPEGFERNSMFLEEMRHFVSVVRGQAEPRATLEDGARALELAVWALSSAQRPAAHEARSEGEG
jgi:predicted dehydrogenase